MAKAIRKVGRPHGATDRKPRKNSPAVTRWALQHGPNVPETGPTAFGAEARDALTEITAILLLPDSWDVAEHVTVSDEWIAVATLPATQEPEPWNHATEGWVWNWLNKAGFVKNELGISFPPFAVLASPRKLIRLHPSGQMECVSFARRLLLFGQFVLRAVIEKYPQGFLYDAKSSKRRPVSGQEALAGLAEMAVPHLPDQRRQDLLQSALKLRGRKFNTARKLRDANPFFMEEQVEISFRDLVKEHTGEEIRSLEITNKRRLELIRRYAHEFAKAGTIRLSP